MRIFLVDDFITLVADWIRPFIYLLLLRLSMIKLGQFDWLR